MKTLLLKTTMVMLFAAIAIVTLSQVNYEQAMDKARQVDTDGEIQSVLQDHGFEVGIYDKITVSEKLSALFIVLGRS